MPQELAVGVDFGGTRIKCVLTTADGRILEREVRATEDRHDASVNREQWIQSIGEIVTGFRARYAGASIRLGLAAPGIASRDHKMIAFMSGRLAGLEGLHWSQELGLDLDVSVLNDAHAALLGEVWCGAARELDNVVLLTLGTGVGGAILIDGELYTGSIGRGGHLGHLSLDPSGKPDICRTPGSLEDEIGECTLRERSRGRFATSKELIDAADSGDEFAQQVWDRSIRSLAAALASLINVLDPERIILAGGVAAAGDSLLGPLKDQLDEVEWRPKGHKTEVVLTELGSDAGALGAAYRAFASSDP